MVELTVREGLLWVILLLGGLYYLYQYITPVKSGNPKNEEITRHEKVSPISRTRNIAERMKLNGKNMVIFHGSQAGTAEDFSVRLAKEAGKDYGLSCLCCDPEDYDAIYLHEVPAQNLIVFIFASYDYGHPSDNVKSFFEKLKLLTSEQNRPDFSNLRYCIFGLKNKIFEESNFFATQLDSVLSALGAKRIGSLGEGSGDSCSLENDFNLWKQKTWQPICEFYSIDYSAKQRNTKNKTYSPLYSIKEHADNDFRPEQIFKGEHSQGAKTPQESAGSPYGYKNPFYATISSSSNLVPSKLREEDLGRHSLRMEIDISGSSFHYDAGDQLGIWPENSESNVLKLADLLGLMELETHVRDTSTGGSAISSGRLRLDHLITVISTESTLLPFPVPCTYRTMLTHYLDFMQFPTLNLIGLLVYFYESKEGVALLKKLLEDSTFYQKYIREGRRNVINLLSMLQDIEKKEFPNKEKTIIPVEVLIEGVKPLTCRYYCISSSPKLSPHLVQLTVTLEPWKNTSGQSELGVCCSYLNSIHNHLQSKTISPKFLQCFVKQTRFHLPNEETDILLVGIDSGVAPFIGFIYERLNKKENGMKVGRTLLFIGGKGGQEDILFKNELKELEKKGLEVYPSLCGNSTQPTRILHWLLVRKDDVWELLNRKQACLYICGHANRIIKDAHNAIALMVNEVARGSGFKNVKDASKWLEELRGVGRLFETIWV